MKLLLLLNLYATSQTFITEKAVWIDSMWISSPQIRHGPFLITINTGDRAGSEVGRT